MADKISIRETTQQMTADEFLNLPESNLPTELIAGEVIVSPSPKLNHQWLLNNLIDLLKASIPNGIVWIAPTDLRLNDHTVVQPDLLWISSSNKHCKYVEGTYLQGSPDLVVEILSPGSRRRDKHTKFKLYEAHKIPEYWIADPEHLILEVWKLDDKNNHYVLEGAFESDNTFISPTLGDQSLSLENVLSEVPSTDD